MILILQNADKLRQYNDLRVRIEEVYKEAKTTLVKKLLLLKQKREELNAVIIEISKISGPYLQVTSQRLVYVRERHFSCSHISLTVCSLFIQY